MLLMVFREWGSSCVTRCDRATTPIRIPPPSPAPTAAADIGEKEETPLGTNATVLMRDEDDERASERVRGEDLFSG